LTSLQGLPTALGLGRVALFALRWTSVDFLKGSPYGILRRAAFGQDRTFGAAAEFAHNKPFVTGSRFRVAMPFKASAAWP